MLGDLERLAKRLDLTNLPEDKSLASVLRGLIQMRRKDVPWWYPENLGNVLKIPENARKEYEKRGRIVYVELHGETLAELCTLTGTHYDWHKEGVDVPAMNGIEVAVNLDHLTIGSTQDFVGQRNTIYRENKPIKGFDITNPPTVADAVTIALKVFDKTNINILQGYTRIGRYGDTIVGRLYPGESVDIQNHMGLEAIVGIELLCIAIPTIEAR
jgi:hypothetical protein